MSKSPSGLMWIDKEIIRLAVPLPDLLYFAVRIVLSGRPANRRRASIMCRRNFVIVRESFLAILSDLFHGGTIGFGTSITMTRAVIAWWEGWNTSVPVAEVANGQATI